MPRRTKRPDLTETADFVFFWGGWPSQWHRCRFVVDGVHPRAHDPAQWQGTNWLGQALDRVRDQLRANNVR